jgi:hypothetical protein
MGKGKPKIRQIDASKIARRPVAQLPQRTGLAMRPLFSLEYVDRGSTHAFHFDLDADDAKSLLEFLRDIGNNSWSAIRAQVWSSKRDSHRKHHEHPIEAVCEDAKTRLLAMKLNEIIGDDLFRFRVSAKQRLWGFVADGTFHILWWDPAHEVYPLAE